MNNKVQWTRKSPRLACVWIATGDANKPLACVWTQPEIAQQLFAASSKEEPRGVRLCA